MKLFRKKKNQHMHNMLIEAFNFTPPDYQHTDGYYKRLQRPLEDARKDIKNIPTTALLDKSTVVCDIRDQSIDSFCNAEVIFGQKQYIHNLGTILQIFDSINESAPTAEAKKNHLRDDLEKIKKEITKYEEMQSKSSL